MTNATLGAKENGDAHQPRKLIDPYVNDENEEQQNSERIKTEMQNLGKPVTRSNNVKKYDMDTRE